MTNFIPVFPLNIVVFPNETLNLHIFEPRYIQMMQDCITQKKPFGILTVLDGKFQEYGTLISIKEVVKQYEDGRMDVKTTATKVFRVLETITHLPEKLYGGAIVNYPNYYNDGFTSKMQKIIEYLKQFHANLNITKDYKKPDSELRIYDIVHHAGLTTHQEYELLCLAHESQQQEYLNRHFSSTSHNLEAVNQTKERIKLNGHFRDLHLDGFNL